MIAYIIINNRTNRMAFQFHIDHDAGILELYYAGEIKLKEREQARSEFFSLCKQHQLTRGLVEMQDSDIYMTEDDVIKFTSSFKNMDLPVGYRMAGVIKHDDKADRLMELLLSLEGMDTRFFLNRGEALKWLKAC